MFILKGRLIDVIMVHLGESITVICLQVTYCSVSWQLAGSWMHVKVDYVIMVHLGESITAARVGYIL